MPSRDSVAPNSPATATATMPRGAIQETSSRSLTPSPAPMAEELYAQQEKIRAVRGLRERTEQQRRDWAFKVLGTDRPAELSDLLLEFSGNVHRDWLDKEWKPWKELTSSSDMTKEEQQAAIASGMMEDPEEIRKEQERKKLEEEERKRKAIEALPAPWTNTASST